MTGKISEMPPEGSLDGTEIVPLVHGGGNARTTTQAIADLASSATIGHLNGINDQTGTSYTVATTDAGKDVRCTNAAAVALNIVAAATSGITAGFWCLFSQGGAGAVTATAGSGVTLRTPNGAATTAQYDARGLEYLGSDEWRVW